MAGWLLRRWFLIVLALGLGVAMLRPGWARPVTERLPLRLVVGLSLFLAACGLEGERLLRALARPRTIAWGLGISYVFVPLAAVAAAPLLPTDDLRVGLLVIACVPCTLSSAVLWTRQAGGDEAVALVVVVLTNALGWLVTPLWLAGAGPGSVALDGPALMRSLALVLVLPVLLGQAARRLPRVADTVARYRAPLGAVTRLLVTAVLIAAAVDAASQADLLSLGLVLTTVVVCSLVHLGGLFLGVVGGRLVGLERGDRIAVGFAGSQKTLPVALFVFGYFREEYPLAVLPLLLYHAAQLVLDTLVADRLAAGQVGDVP